MVMIYVKKNEPIDKIIKTFESKCRKAQVYRLVQQKSYYISKSERRRKRKSRR